MAGLTAGSSGGDGGTSCSSSAAVSRQPSLQLSGKTLNPEFQTESTTRSEIDLPPPPPVAAPVTVASVLLRRLSGGEGAAKAAAAKAQAREGGYADGLGDGCGCPPADEVRMHPAVVSASRPKCLQMLSRGTLRF